MTGTSSAPVHTLNITFNSAPTVGTYTIVASSPTVAGTASVAYDGTFGQSGNLVVTSSSGKFTATFTSISFVVFTASGSLTCM